MASSSNPPDDSARIHDLQYLYASNTNVSSFVSVKLSGDHNYHLWQKQMICLMKTHGMYALVDDDLKSMKSLNNLYDILLQGWILGSVSEDVLRMVVDLDSAKDVWKKLKSCFDSTKSSKQELHTDSASTIAYTKTKKEDKNVALEETTTNDKDINSEESEAKGEQAIKIERKDSPSRKVDIKRETEEKNVDLGETTTNDNDIYSEQPKVKYEDSTQITKDLAPTNVYKKIETENEETNSKLGQLIMDGDWYGVYDELKEKSTFTKKLNSDGNTLLHIAVGIGRTFLMERILDSIKPATLTTMKNADESTALHIAAIVGNTEAVEILIKVNKDLLNITDKEDKKPLDRAYENMHLHTIAYLLEATEDHDKGKQDTKSKKDNDRNGTGQTVTDVEGTRSTLLPSVDIGVDLLVNAISAKEYDFSSTWIRKNPEYAVSEDNVLMALARTFPSGLDDGEKLFYPSLHHTSEMIVKRTKSFFSLTTDIFSGLVEFTWSALCFEYGFRESVQDGAFLFILVPALMVYWIYHVIILLLLMVYFPFFMVYLQLWKVTARIVPIIKNIEQKKKEHQEAKEVLKLVLDTIIKKRPDSSIDLYTGPILEASCQDAYEVVVQILGRWPEAIRCKDNNGYDIIQLATTHRSERIYNLIYMIGERKSIYRTKQDSSNNNMLHLAGRLAPLNKLKRRTGAALQLQSELQWQQEVKKLVFPSYVTKENIFMETPETVFTRQHENLVKEGEKWMKTVAESCSITAALITTIVFAAAITVPGGSNQETGIPVFTNEATFTIFAIADAISLFSSATALLVFLSILTARFAQQDFLVSLPRRLIIGLCTLLISTTAMMVAFSATLFLVFSHKKLWVLAPICGLAILPIAIFFILQFPLIVDLFYSTYISKFGKIDNKGSGFNPNVRFFFGK